MSKYITCYYLDEKDKPILHRPFIVEFSDETWQKITQLEKQNKEKNMVEKVTEIVEKYKSKDGNLYDALEKAEKADKEWERKNSFDPAKEVARLQKLCEINFSRIQKRIDEGKKQFPSFWMTKQKYGKDYYMCNSFDDMEEMGWSAFIMWYDYYMCGTDETVAVAKLIKETENKKAALEFVFDRCSNGYEYEKMEKIYMTTFNRKEENNV